MRGLLFGIRAVEDRQSPGINYNRPNCNMTPSEPFRIDLGSTELVKDSVNVGLHPVP
jgi:hypothetical protein